MSRFKSFTKIISRRNIGFLIVFLMLIAPAFITPAVESAQTKNAKKATPTPKKKTTPTPKKAQAKTTPTPKKSTKTAAKTTAKTTTNSSKTKTGAVKPNSKTTDKSKTTTTVKNKKAASTTNKNTSSKTTKPTTAKTTKPATKTPTKSNTQSKPKTNTSTTKTTNVDSQVIVTAYSVPIKSEAKTGAKSLTNAGLGATYKVTEKSGSWYKVQYTSGGKTSSGWISAASVNDLDNGNKAATYRQIAERNYSDNLTFTEAAEFSDFVKQISGELGATDADAEVELKRLLALRTALKNIPIEEKEQSPYKEFLKKYDAEIIYNEPAGMYLVASNQFWELHTKYAKSVVSDKIAWEAAMNPLPGECEGYVNCYLFDMRMRFGEYLNLHPNGKNSAEALTNIINYLSPIVADLQQKTIYNGPTDVTDRAEFNNLIAELRTIISRVPHTEKEKALQQLKQIAEGFR